MTLYPSQLAWHADPKNKERKQATWRAWNKANPKRRAAIQKKSYMKRKARLAAD